MGTSDKDATARSAAVLIGNAIKAYLGERRGGNMSAVDAADELTGLYARLAHKAYQTNAYALLWPAQVARIDATIVQAADPSGAATRVQIPATQAAEYAAVAAMRESEGMDAGIDARAHWGERAAGVRGAVARSPTSKRHGVVVRKGEPLPANDDAANSLQSVKNGNPAERFNFLDTGKEDVDAHSYWVYEDAGAVNEERASVVYLAMRIAAVAMHTPPGKREHVAAEGDAAHASGRTRREGVCAGDQWQKRSHCAAHAHRRAGKDAHQAAGGTTPRPPIAWPSTSRSGPMRVDRLRRTVASAVTIPEEMATAGGNESLIDSRERVRTSMLQASVGNWDGFDLDAALAPLTAASAVRANAPTNGQTAPLNGRDVTRVSGVGLNPTTSWHPVARRNAHSGPAWSGVGYADGTTSNEKRLSYSLATPHMVEGWATLGVYSPESAHRAAGGAARGRGCRGAPAPAARVWCGSRRERR